MNDDTEGMGAVCWLILFAALSLAGGMVYVLMAVQP
jgi:hypothetical protein